MIKYSRQASRVGGGGVQGGLRPGKVERIAWALSSLYVTLQRQKYSVKTRRYWCWGWVEWALIYTWCSWCPGAMVYFLANEIWVFLVMPFLTNQKIISVIFWLVEIDQSGSRLTNQWDYFVSKCSNMIGSEWGILIGCWVGVGLALLVSCDPLHFPGHHSLHPPPPPTPHPFLDMSDARACYQSWSDCSLLPFLFSDPTTCTWQQINLKIFAIGTWHSAIHYKAYFKHGAQFLASKTSPVPHSITAILDLNPGWQSYFG